MPPKHECSISDLCFGKKPIDEPAGECVSFPVRCRVCGREFHEVFSRNEGLWDPDQETYVFLPANSERG